MAIARALFLTLVLLNYERWTRLAMVLRVPLGSAGCECVRSPYGGRPLRRGPGGAPSPKRSITLAPQVHPQVTSWGAPDCVS